MELKDKLDLLWKYLLLLVLVVGMFSHLCHRGYGKYGCGKYSKGCWHQQQKNDFQSEVKDIQIKMEISAAFGISSGNVLSFMSPRIW